MISSLGAGLRLQATFKAQAKEITVGNITVHEFITLDGVIEQPTWTFD